MLTKIKIKNIALIEEVEIDLDKGLNIFSGETGAGKSMLIDAIEFAIGHRSAKQMIRKGEDAATVILYFKDSVGEAIKFLKEHKIPQENDIIELERYVTLAGRTVYKLNHTVTTRQIVRQLAAYLIDVHGQHEPQSLLDVSTHIKLLDSFGGEAFIKEKEKYKMLYERWQQVKKTLETIEKKDRTYLQLKDLYTFQVEEIHEAQLKEGEEEELKQQYDMLSHAEKIMSQCQVASYFLDGENEMGTLTTLGKAIQALSEVSTITDQLTEVYEQFLSVQSELQEATYQMREIIDTIDYSPQLLTDIQERLDTIYKLKQKYGNSIKEILDYQANCERELETLTLAEQNRDELEKEYQTLQGQLEIVASRLTQHRQEIAKLIETQIDSHLHDLQMPYAKFEIAIEQIDTFTSDGQNDVEFLIRTNLGEDIHALAKIASGGELSRVMLAIKTVLFLGDHVHTVIFDEIDTGMSGLAAQKVAEKLALIAKTRQVICITHLPQIAAMSEKHYLIEKQAIEDKTITSIKALDENEIYYELTRLMGGVLSKSTLKSAVELKNRAKQFKNPLP